MTERHWKAISEKAGVEIHPDVEDFTF